MDNEVLHSWPLSQILLKDSSLDFLATANRQGGVAVQKDVS